MSEEEKERAGEIEQLCQQLKFSVRATREAQSRADVVHLDNKRKEGKTCGS